MRYKHIASVGALLIAIFISLAALMYYFNQDSCPVGTFRCRNSTLCLPQRNWCNGIRECPEGDDESQECYDLYGDWGCWKPPVNKTNLFCPNVTKGDAGYYESCEYKRACSLYCNEFPEPEIPQTLSINIEIMNFVNSTFPVLREDFFTRYSHLRRLLLRRSSISELEKNVFRNQSKLTELTISDNEIKVIARGHLVGLKSLEELSLDNNKIYTLDLTDLANNTNFCQLDLSKNLLTTSAFIIPFLPELTELNLDENRLEMITNDMFAGLPMLSSLSLESNLIESISPKAFKALRRLIDLNLMYNKIKVIPPNLFISVGNLTVLDIGHNPIEVLTSAVFEPLATSLKSLNVEEIDMEIAEEHLFEKLMKLDFVYFKKFHFCTTYAPHVQRCRPSSDGVSSLSHLLGKPLLRAAVWGISSVTCLGNALVLWGRFTAKDENRMLSIVIRNLAVSDLLMGLYLFIIGLEDIRFRNNYNQEANAWISSWSCTLIGMVAMTSSEVSVLILSFMSVERFMLIAAPLKGHRGVTPQTAATAMILVWVIGITLALIPAIHWHSSTRFYGLNGMCFPLHIEEPFLVGWEYSAFIFLGLNLLGLITIGFVYAALFASIWKTRHATPLSVGDSEFALRFFLIVLTDSVCWAPIIILKFMALAEYPVTPDLHAWVVVFILPVNSAVNPLLYTFTTPKFRERLSEGWFGRMRNAISRRQSRSDSQTSTFNNKSIMICMPAAAKIANETPNPVRPILIENLMINFMTKEE